MPLYRPTPLSERMDRWANSGKAKSMPLHPQDFFALSKANLVEKVSEKYGLEVTCLGGEKGLQNWIKDRITDKEVNEAGE